MGYPAKGRADFFVPGDWNYACSMCGRKRKASELVRNWQGLYRCPEHNEPRQPQDFSRGVLDDMTVPFQLSESDVFVQICTLNGISAIPDEALPDCSIPNNPVFNPFMSP